MITWLPRVHGKPTAFYSDRHAVFHVSKHDAHTERLTQFGRVLQELNIELICANSSQAKGRVERANKTLQDRLVKEMRLQGINIIEQAMPVSDFIANFPILHVFLRHRNVQPSSKKSRLPYSTTNL